MAQAWFISTGMVKVILSLLGRDHDTIVSMGWPSSYEFFCTCYMDCKLSYDPHSGYYIKSYGSKALLNVKHFLRFHVLYSKALRGAIDEPEWFVKGYDYSFRNYYRSVCKTDMFQDYILDDEVMNSELDAIFNASVRRDVL